MRFKAKEIEVPDDEPFKNDRLSSKTHVDNLSFLLENLDSPIVVSINAPWGQGKTTFLKMLNKNLQQKKFKTVFFSAWETDFTKEPLLTFLGEINKQIDSFLISDNDKKQLWLKAKKAGLHIIQKGIPALIKIGTAGIIDAEEIIEEQAATLASELSNDAINAYLHDKEQISIFKESLSKIFSNSEDKLYIFIDELDRCRPNYAIELLERLKHLLDINGLVFILAMDKTQLGHSVKAIYGQDFESVGYLRRFIDIEYNIPKRNLDVFIDGLYQDLGFNLFFEKRKKYRAFQYEKSHLSNVFKLLANEKKLTLREIEQLFAKVNLVIQSTAENIYLFPALLAFLIITKEFHSDIYERFIIESSTPEEIIDLLYKIIPEATRVDSFECALIEAFLICAKKNYYDERLGQSLKRHEEIKKSNTDDKQTKYSKKVTSIVANPVDDFGVEISLEEITARIGLLKNFTFHMGES